MTPPSPEHHPPSRLPSADDDVFFTDTTSPNPEPSDIPRLRSTHTTAGYREGLASSKEKALQPGFDEGYPLGAVFGLKIGWILGTLEGIYNALHAAADAGDESGRVKELLVRAGEELKVEKLFARPYWREDGTWEYHVEGEEEGGEATFVEVVEGHPVVKGWIGRVKEEMGRWGLEEKVFEGEEWEAGRVDGG